MIDTIDICSEYKRQVGRYLVDNLMERIRKTEFMLQFEVLPQHLHGGTEGNQPG
jgi:hypothetical protein